MFSMFGLNKYIKAITRAYNPFPIFLNHTDPPKKKKKATKKIVNFPNDIILGILTVSCRGEHKKRYKRPGRSYTRTGVCYTLQFQSKNQIIDSNFCFVFSVEILYRCATLEFYVFFLLFTALP